MSSDSEIELEAEVLPSAPPRMSRREDALREYAVTECSHVVPFVNLRVLRVGRQSGNTCLAHSIVNAAQRPERYGELRRTLRAVATESGWDPKDIASGIEACRRTLGLAMHPGIDLQRDSAAVAHVFLHNHTIDHFVALRKLDGAWYILDSLDGTARLLTRPDVFQRRASFTRVLCD